MFVHNRVRTSYRIIGKNDDSRSVVSDSVLPCEALLIVEFGRLAHSLGNRTSLMVHTRRLVSVIGIQRDSEVHGLNRNMVL